MKNTIQLMGCMILAAMLAITGCGNNSGGGGKTNEGRETNGGGATYMIVYDGNGATGGAVPVDTTNYETGMSVVVKGNTGVLVKTGFAFAGWSTQADGGGTTYSDGATFVMGGTDVTLYAKWMASGSLDTSFDPGEGADGNINCIAVQSDGKILIGGEFTTYNGTPRNSIARLNADGTLDTSFNPGTGVKNPVTGTNKSIYSIAVQEDGKILIGGDFATYNDTNRIRIARLNADGTLDTTFDLVDYGVTNNIYTIAVQEDGKIFIGGSFQCYDLEKKWVIYYERIARLNADGSFDTSFHWGKGEVNNDIYSIALLNEQILIAGNFTTYEYDTRNRIARLDAYGTLDTSFDPGGGADNNIRSMVVQGDGKILIGGHFTYYDGTLRKHISRLDAYGKLDTSFDPGDGANWNIYSMAVQSDGKILIGGMFTSYNGTPRKHIARIWY